MTPWIASALLGAWTYAGFVDEPGRRAPPIVPPAPPPAVVPADDPEILPEPAPQPPPPMPPAPNLPPDPAPPPAAPQPPQVRFRMSDECGQVWEHPDPQYLAAWVAARNRSGLRCTNRAAIRP